MKLLETVQKLALTPRTADAGDVEITGGYCSDLLSDVLKNAKSGFIWVTNQKHQNCVAVASLLDLCAVIIVGGVEPDAETLEKAASEQVPLYTTTESAFDIAGRLYEMGIRGPISP
jgi:hypothetical protein